MAVAYRAGSLATTAITVATVSPTVNAPNGLQDGDLIIVAIATNSSQAGGGAGDPPAGWTRTIQAQGTDMALFLLIKIASGEGASWTFTDIFLGTELCAAVAVAYTGVDATTPLDVAEVTDDLGALTGGTGYDTSSITPTSNNCMIVSIFGSDPPGAQSSIADADPSCTEIADYCEDNFYGWLYIQEHLQGSATAEAHTVTPSISDGVCYKILALRPAAAGGLSIPVAMAYYERLRRN